METGGPGAGRGREGLGEQDPVCLCSPPCMCSLMSPQDGGCVSLFFPILGVEANTHTQKSNHAQRSSISRVCLNQLRKCSDAGSKIVFCTLSKTILSELLRESCEHSTHNSTHPLPTAPDTNMLPRLVSLAWSLPPLFSLYMFFQDL